MTPRLSLVLLLLILVGSACLRIRLLAVPLERDEGEYAYIAQGLLQGIPPYTDGFTMKLPGTPLAYAAIIRLFGETTVGIHLGLMFVHLLTIIAVYCVATRLFGPLAGLAAAGSDSVLSLTTHMGGYTANAEPFAILPAMVGVLCLLSWRSTGLRSRLVLAGGCFGLAVLAKQHALFFAIGAVVGVFWQHWSARSRSKVLLLGDLSALALLPILEALILLLVLWAAGSWTGFVDWVFVRSRGYVAQTTWLQAWEMFWFAMSPILWFGAPIFLVAVWGFITTAARAAQRTEAAVLLLLAVSGVLAILPGLYFRHHYFLFVMPAVAVAFGAGVRNLAAYCRSSIQRAAGVAWIVVPLGWGLLMDGDTFFFDSPEVVSIRAYGSNPFVESPQIAELIASRTSPDERVGLLGSEPQILFHAHRRSATPYIYMYPLTEVHPQTEALQQDLIGRLTEAAPRYVVFVGEPMSWLFRPETPDGLSQWILNELPMRYRAEQRFAIRRPGRPSGEIVFYLRND